MGPAAPNDVGAQLQKQRLDSIAAQQQSVRDATDTRVQNQLDTFRRVQEWSSTRNPIREKRPKIKDFGDLILNPNAFASYLAEFVTDPARKAKLYFITADELLGAEIITVVIWIVMAVVFGAWFLPWVYGLLKPGCPSVNGQVCNGAPNVCGEFGLCVCLDPLFSGPDCGDSLIPGYIKNQPHTACFDRGVTSPTLTYANIIPECKWTNPSISNPIGSGGWLQPECVNRITAIRAQRDLLVKSGDYESIKQIDGIASVPTCWCYDSWTGNNCEDNACPYDSARQVCSNRGLKTVGLFYNDTTTGNGCQSSQTFSFFNTTIQNALSDEARVQAQTYYLDQLYRNFAGVPLITDGALVTIIMVDAFGCICKDGAFGVRCQFGGCLVGDNGLECSGNGDPLYGAGVLRNTSLTQNDGRTGVIKCAGTTTRCLTNVCGPYSPLEFDHSKWCFVGEASKAENKWRCSDGSLISDRFPNCAAGFTTATLNPDAYDALRETLLCDLRSIEGYESCFGPLNQTDTYFVQGAYTELQNFGVTKASPIAWYVAQGKNPTGQNQTIRVSSGTYSRTFVLEGPNFAVYDTIDVSQAEFLLQRYVSTDWDLTVSIFDDRIVVSPYPYFEISVRDEWKQFRMWSRQNEYVECVGQLLQMVLSDPTPNTNVTINVGDDLVASTGTNPVALESCLANPAICVFWYNGTYLVNNVTNQYVCTTATTYTFSSTPCAVYAPGLQTATMTLIARNLVEITSTLAYRPLNWVFQQIRPDVHSIAFNASTQLQLLTLEVVQVADVVRPCLCLTPLNARNQSEANSRWFNQRERARSVYRPSVPVVVPFSDFGVPNYYRGRVVESDELQTAVDVFGFGQIRVKTSDARSISNDQFLEGLPDYSVEAYYAKCPTGQNAHAKPNLLALNDRCFCDQTTTSTTCGCTAKNQTCACTQTNGASGAATCDCNDPLLEVPLQSSINATANCFCFVSDFAPIEPYTTVFEGLDVITGVERPIEFFEFESCFMIDQIVGVDTRSDSTDLLSFTVACTGSMQVQVTTNAYSFGRYVFVTTSNYTGTTTVHWSPIGFPVASLANITWTASSNSQNASLVETFDAFHWSSDNKYVPQWIEAQFNQSVNIAGVNLILSDGALHVATFLPVEFSLYGFDTEWFLVQTFLVEATPTSSQQFSLNVSRTVTKLRVQSPLGFTVRLFSPVVDSWCACADPNVQVQLNRPYPPISTNQVWDSLDYILAHTTNESCVAQNTCILTPPGGQPYLKNTTGECNDLRNWLIVNGVTETIRVEFVTWAVYSWLEFYQQWFPPFTGTVTVTSEFQNVNISGTITNQTFWCVFPSTGSCQLTYTEAWIAYNAGNQSFAETAFIFVDLDDLIFNQAPCFYVPTTQTLVFGAFTNTTTYSAPIPTGTVCPSGYDLINCGKSNRDVAALPNVNCFLNDTLNPFYLSLLNQSTPSAFRPLSTFLANGATANVTHFVRHDYLNFVSGCTEQTCPYARCKNGACVDFADQCDDRYDIGGSGCVANDLNRQFYSCACGLGFDGPDCSVQNTQPVVNPFDETRNPYLDNKCGAPGPMRVNQAFAPIETGRVKNTPSVFLAVNRAVNRRRCSCVTGQICTCNDVHQYQIQMTHAPWQPIFEFLQTTGSGERILSYVFPNHLTRTGSYANIYTDVQIYNPRTRQATYTVYFDNDLQPYSYYYNTTDYELTWSQRPIPCANGQPASVRSECAVLEKLYPVCNRKGTCQGGGYCKCNPGWRTMVFTQPYSQAIQIPYTSKLFEGQYVPVPTDFYGDPNWNWLYFGPSWCLDPDCSMQDCSAPVGCFPGTSAAGYRDALVSCGPEYPTKCAPSRQLCLQGANLTDQQICSNKGIAVRVDYTNQTVCFCGDPISRTATIAQVDSITQLKPNGFGGPACNVRQCNVGPIYFLRRDPHTNAPFTDLGKQIYGRWFAYCDDDPKKPAPFVGANPTDAQVWQKCCGTETRLERCVNQPCALNGQSLCLPGDVCLARGGAGLAQVCNGQGTPNADGTCTCDYDSLSGGYGADYNVFSRPNCYKRVLCAISRQTNTACRSADQRRIYFPKGVLNLPDSLWMNGQSEAALAAIGLSPTNNTLIPLVTTFNQMNQVLMQSAVNQITQLNIANNSLYNCYCIFPNQPCDAQTTMVNYCGSPIQYAQAYRSPFLLNYTTNFTLSSDTDFYTWYPEPQNVYDLSNGLNVYLPQRYTLTTFHIWAKSNATATVQIDILTFDDQVICPPTAVIANDTWKFYTIYCDPKYQDFDFYAQGGALQRAVLQNCGAPNSELSVSTTCIDWQRQTCTDVGGVYSDPNSLNRYRGCLLNRCCVLVADFASRTVDKFRVVGQVQMQIMNVFGYSDVIQDLPYVFVLESYYRSGYLQASQRPDQKFMSFYWGQDKTFWVPGDVVQNCSFAALSTCSPFNNTQTFLNFTDAVRVSKTKGGYLATSNDPVVGSLPEPKDPALAEPLNSRDPKRQYQAGWISIRNVAYNPNAGLDAYVSTTCNLGCRTITPYRATPFGLYSAKDFAVWANKWHSSLLDGGWLSYFRNQRIAPFDSYMLTDQAYFTAYTEGWGQYGFPGVQYNPWNPSSQFVPAPGIGRAYKPNYDTTDWVSQRITDCNLILYQNPFCSDDPGSLVTNLALVPIQNPPKPYISGTNNYLQTATRKRAFSASMSMRNFFDAQDDATNAWAFGIDLDDIFRAWPDKYTAWGGFYGARGFKISGRNCRIRINAYTNQALTNAYPLNTFDAVVDGSGGVTFERNSGSEDNTLNLVSANTRFFRDTFGSRAECSAVFTGFSRSNFDQYLGTTVWKISDEPSFTLGFKFTYLSNIDWIRQTNYIEAESVDPGIQPPNRFGTEGFSRARTLAWLAQPYMCQGIQTRVNKLLPAYNNPNYPGGYLRYFFTQRPDQLGTNYGQFPNKYLRGSYWQGNVNDLSSMDYPFPTFSWPLFTPSVPITSGLATCGSLGRPITLCRDCEITQNARFYFNQLVYPRYGDTFVEEQNMLLIGDTVGTFNTFVSSAFIGTNRVATSNPLVLRFARPNSLSLLANVGDGAVYLYKLFESTNRNDLAVATNQACSLRIEDFGTKWTQGNCGAVDRNAGVMFAYPCENEIAQVVQIDYTKGTAFPGSLCDIDGPSLRTGGAPNSLNCFQLFPQLNSSTNPYPFYLKQKYDAGTLAFSLTVGANTQDFDSARQFLDEIKFNYVEAIPGVRQRIDQGISTQPGALSRGQFADPVSWTNFDFSQIWPTYCGLKCSQFTGECSYLIAKSIEFCDIDLAVTLESLNGTQRQQIGINQLPSVLLPFDQTTGNPKLALQCGTAIDLTQWFEYDTFGAPTQPDTYELLSLRPVHVRVTSLNGTIANTGKNPAQWVFNNKTTYVSGTVGLEQTDGTATINVWIAPLSYTYVITHKLYIGTVSVSTTTTYSFTVSVTNETVYQVVGFDFAAPIDSVLSFTNPVLSTDDSITACLSIHGQLPKYAPLDVVRIDYPNHQCVANEDQLPYTPNTDIGECFCDPNSGQGGVSCDAAVVQTQRGKLIGSGYNTTGLAVDPDGNLQQTDADGTYCFVRDGDTICYTKIFDAARAVLTKLTLATYAYPAIFRLSSSYGESSFVVLPTDRWITFDEAEAAATENNKALPAIVNADSMDDFAAVYTRPVFMALQEDLDNGYWFWTDRGVQLADSNSSVAVFQNQVCDTANFCAAINFNNLAYGTSGNYLTDGALTAVAFTGQSVSINTPGTYFVYVYSSTTRTLTGCSTTTSVASNTNFGLVTQKFICIVTTSATFTPSAGGFVSEIQLFQALDTCRTSAYGTYP